MKFFDNIFNRNPCKECDYYRNENNTCQIKKATMRYPIVTLSDRIFCKPHKFSYIGKDNHKN